MARVPGTTTGSDPRVATEDTSMSIQVGGVPQVVDDLSDDDDDDKLLDRYLEGPVGFDPSFSSEKDLVEGGRGSFASRRDLAPHDEEEDDDEEEEKELKEEVCPDCPRGLDDPCHDRSLVRKKIGPRVVGPCTVRKPLLRGLLSIPRGPVRTATALTTTSPPWPGRRAYFSNYCYPRTVRSGRGALKMWRINALLYLFFFGGSNLLVMILQDALVTLQHPPRLVVKRDNPHDEEDHHLLIISHRIAGVVVVVSARVIPGHGTAQESSLEEEEEQQEEGNRDGHKDAGIFHDGRHRRPRPRQSVQARQLSALLFDKKVMKKDAFLPEKLPPLYPPANSSSHHPPHLDDTTCGLWLAPSTIPGAGLGMYAGRDFQPEERFMFTGDVVIPLVDMGLHLQVYRQEFPPRSSSSEGGEEEEVVDDRTFLWDEYTWGSEGLFMHIHGVQDVNAASPGFGSAANCFLPLENVHEGSPENHPAYLHRSRDPGAGAFSTYWDRFSSAQRHIEAGEELFVSYGETWFIDRPQLGPIPLTNHLAEGQQLYEKFAQLQKQVAAPPGTNSTLFQDLWYTFIHQSRFSDSRIFGAFRRGEIHDAEQAWSELEPLQEMDLTTLRQTQSRRPLDWFESYGTCGDHLYGALSSIPQAGRGAFARRSLPAGTVVALLPMVHVPDRERLRMYPLHENEDGSFVPDMHAPRPHQQYQLLLNYCFGHAESTMLLCPYGPMAPYVNHGTSPQYQPNVALQWADPKRSNHMPELFQKPLEDFASDVTAKLAMQLVALRDIAANEEVLLDYGAQWQAAWDLHVATWIPVPGAEEYVSAWQYNHQYRDEPIRTDQEQMTEPYPSHIQLFCDATVLRQEEWRPIFDSNDIESFRKFLSNEKGLWEECNILQRHVDEHESAVDYHYTIVVALKDEESDRDWDRKRYTVERVPRDFIQFADRPYTADFFLDNAFRHSIGIPDDLFPEAWRNRRPSQNVSP